MVVFVLAVPMILSLLGVQGSNSEFSLQLNRAHCNLRQKLRSSLLNQVFPLLSTNYNNATPTASCISPALSNSAMVAKRIRGGDGQLQALPPIALNSNDSTLKQAYGWLAISCKTGHRQMSSHGLSPESIP